MRQENHEINDHAASFLTERQVKVLMLRQKGRSQQEVAEIMGTTRSNISILEKRAHQNIARARNTIRQWMAVVAPISLNVPAGTDVFDIPGRIFEAADLRSIQLPVTSLDIIVRLRREAPKLFVKRALSQEIEIYVNEDGAIIIREPSQESFTGDALTLKQPDRRE